MFKSKWATFPVFERGSEPALTIHLFLDELLDGEEHPDRMWVEKDYERIHQN